jgi:hypothetical protein
LVRGGVQAELDRQRLALAELVEGGADLLPGAELLGGAAGSDTAGERDGAGENQGGLAGASDGVLLAVFYQLTTSADNCSGSTIAASDTTPSRRVHIEIARSWAGMRTGSGRSS